MNESVFNQYWTILTKADDLLAGGRIRRHDRPASFSVIREVPEKREPAVIRPASTAPEPLVTDALPSSSGKPSSDAVSSDQLPFPRSEALLTLQERKRLLDELADGIRGCFLCALHQGRTQAVAGDGSLDPLLMVISPAPGPDDEVSGKSMSGKPGEYLDKWLSAIQLNRREHVYLADVVKCRTLNGADPSLEEISACLPYLLRQIELVRPRIILTLGEAGFQAVLGSHLSLAEARGEVHSYRGIPLVATYHPREVLGNPEYRRPVWDDLKLVQSALVS